MSLHELKKLLTISSIIVISLPTTVFGACSDNYCSNPNIPLYVQGDRKLAQFVSSQIGRTVRDTGWCAPTAVAMITRGAVFSSGLNEAQFQMYGHGGNFQTYHLYNFQERVDPTIKYPIIYDMMRKLGTNIVSGGTYNSSVNNYFNNAFGNLATVRGSAGVGEIRYKIRTAAALYWAAIGAYRNGQLQWGHSIAIRGYDQDKLIINDPWGKIYNVSVDGNRLSSIEGGSVQSIGNSKMETRIDMTNGLALMKATTGGANNLQNESRQDLVGQALAPVLSGKTYYLKGWACGFGSNDPAEVNVYSGADLNSATFLGTFPANKTAGKDITRTCGLPGSTSPHVFQIPVDMKMAAYRGQKLFFSARSPNGSDADILLDNGVYKMPDARQTLGTVDRIGAESGKIYVAGWACAFTHPKSISIKISASSTTAAKATALITATAALASEPGVSNACGSNFTAYRFKTFLSDAAVLKYSGKKVFVYGISPFKYANNLLTNSGKIVIKDTRVTKGFIDGIANDSLNGWACAHTNPSAINVSIYLNAPQGKGTLLTTVKANVASEVGVASACGTTAKAYRFKVPMTKDMKTKFAGKVVYANAISPFKLTNTVLTNSGKFRIPALPKAPVVVAKVPAVVAKVPAVVAKVPAVVAKVPAVVAKVPGVVAKK
jgi:hypothetical protein